MQQRPRIVLLYADPLVDITNDGQNQTPSVPLDFVNELSKAYDAVLGSGVDIDCQFHIATPNNFLDALWDKSMYLSSSRHMHFFSNLPFSSVGPMSYSFSSSIPLFFCLVYQGLFMPPDLPSLPLTFPLGGLFVCFSPHFFQF